MKKNNLILLLVAVVVVSGCTGGTEQTASTTSPGVSITDFSVNPFEARSGQTVLAKMVVENDGQRDINATDYFALLIHGSEWIINEGNVKSKTAPLRFARGAEKPVPQTFTWNVRAPQSKGIDTPTTFTGRIYYKYETEAVTNVNIYPSSEADTAKDKTETVISKGPIQLEVQVNPDPPVIYSAGDEFTVTIKVKNVGGGVVFSYDNQGKPAADNQTVAQENLGKVSIVIPDLRSADSGLEWSDTSCFSNIQFFGASNEEVTTCAIKVTKMPQAKTQQTIRFITSYGYYLDSKANVILKAR